MPAPTAEAYYRFPSLDEPIKTGDVFRGGAIVAPDEPLLTLAPGFDPRPDGRPARDYSGPIFAHDAPADVADVALVETALVGIGYVMLVSYTCDYSEPGKDHPLRFVVPLHPLAALPTEQGLRGFVWHYPERCPSIFFPLPPLDGHYAQEAFVNLRQIGLLHREVLPVAQRVAALQQPAKHLLWQKLAFMFTRVRITSEQLGAVDARYPSPAARP